MSVAYIARPRACAAIAVFLTLAVSAMAPEIAQASDSITVTLDQAKVIQLPERTSTVIVGNPGIADVTVLKKNGRMIITGKGFGETNLIALDTAGNSVGESIVKVVAGRANVVMIQRGLDRESYHCAPRCEPTIALGDATRYSTDTAAQIKLRNAVATGGEK